MTTGGDPDPPVRSEHGVRIASAAGIDLDGLLLRGVSWGGIRTCLEVPQWDLLVDVGAVDHRQVYGRRVLLTHGHLDHLGGLANHVALRELMGQTPAEYFLPPSLVEPVQRLLALWREIDRAPLEVQLVPLPAGQVLPIQRDLALQSFETVHRVNSQGYLVWRVAQKLNEELQGLPSHEIAQRRKAGEVVTHEVQHAEIAFSGDTRIEGVLQHPAVMGAQRLVLEATFLDERVPVDQARRLGHVHLQEIAEHAERFTCETLVLTHLSQRYSLKEAARLVRATLPTELADRVVLL